MSKNVCLSKAAMRFKDLTAICNQTKRKTKLEFEPFGKLE